MPEWDSRFESTYEELKRDNATGKSKRQTLADSTKIYQASYRLTIYQKHWRFQS